LLRHQRGRAGDGRLFWTRDHLVLSLVDAEPGLGVGQPLARVVQARLQEAPSALGAGVVDLPIESIQFLGEVVRDLGRALRVLVLDAELHHARAPGVHEEVTPELSQRAVHPLAPVDPLEIEAANRGLVQGAAPQDLDNHVRGRRVRDQPQVAERAALDQTGERPEAIPAFGRRKQRALGAVPGREKQCDDHGRARHQSDEQGVAAAVSGNHGKETLERGGHDELQAESPCGRAGGDGGSHE